MILNERTLRQAKSKVSQLQRQLAASSFDDLRSQLASEVKEARVRALGEELRRLETEIDAYEKLKAQTQFSGEALESNALGLLPILGRIAKGLSQKQLAELLEIKEQQIQRYEGEKYAGISLSRYERILSVLGMQLSPEWRATPTREDGQEQQELLKTLPPDVLREIHNRGWIEPLDELQKKPTIETMLRYLVDTEKLASSSALHRKTAPKKRSTNDAALALWRARVLYQAQNKHSALGRTFNVADISWIPQLVSLSVHDDGPMRAIEFLHAKGIAIVVETHLPGTSLDGAAMLLADRTPLIALTLRYDRLDYFWFTLLHELGHILLHFNSGLAGGFFDNLDEVSVEKLEIEADSFARTALISDEAWSASPARFSKTIEPIKIFSSSQKIGIAIVAGRIRRERKNYTLFNEYVGQGKVRRQLIQS
jgi:HTH-type transcriptional regulator/antitoxin HigA